MSFERNVFINCPFDDEYRSILEPLLFTVAYLNFSPRIALESCDSGRPRIEKIQRLILASKYSIHDLSRLKSARKGEYARFNMPFELGVDFGCRAFKKGRWSRKKCLILECERYRYRAALSDLAGSDIQAHRSKPQRVVREVRNWLNSQCAGTMPGATRVWDAFNDFTTDLHRVLMAQGHNRSDARCLPIDEYMRRARGWLRAQCLSG